MRNRIKIQENELSVVRWYLEILEGGVDTKELVKEHAELRKEYQQLIRKTTKKINSLESENLKKKLEIKEAV